MYREWWFNIFKEDPYCIKSLEVFPQVDWLTEDHYINTVLKNNLKVVEIALSKKKYLLLFKECHEILNQVILKGQEKSNLPDLDLLQITWGLLLISPENKTNLNLHYHVLMNNLNYIDMEINYLETLLTSKLARTNKSSSLWNLYKKLYILKPKELNELLDIVIRSNENHPRNYYAWNFMNWAVQINYIFSNDVFINSKFDMLFENLYNYGLKNLNDSSVWNALQQLVYPTSLEHSVYEYNNLCSIMGNKMPKHVEKSVKKLLNDKLLAILNNTADFIMRNKIVYVCPYEFFKNVCIQTGYTDLLERLSALNNASIVFKNGKFVRDERKNTSTGLDVTSDTVCYDKIETLYVQRNKRRIETLYKTFYKT